MGKTPSDQRLSSIDDSTYGTEHQISTTMASTVTSNTQQTLNMVLYTYCSYKTILHHSTHNQHVHIQTQHTKHASTLSLSIKASLQQRQPKTQPRAQLGSARLVRSLAQFIHLSIGLCEPHTVFWLKFWAPYNLLSITWQWLAILSYSARNQGEECVHGMAHLWQHSSRSTICSDGFNSFWLYGASAILIAFIPFVMAVCRAHTSIVISAVNAYRVSRARVFDCMLFFVVRLLMKDTHTHTALSTSASLLLLLLLCARPKQNHFLLPSSNTFPPFLSLPLSLFLLLLFCDVAKKLGGNFGLKSGSGGEII